MTVEDQAISATLDARDGVYLALSRVKALREFRPDVVEALYDIENSLTAAINIQLELRRSENQRVAA